MQDVEVHNIAQSGHLKSKVFCIKCIVTHFKSIIDTVAIAIMHILAVKIFVNSKILQVVTFLLLKSLLNDRVRLYKGLPIFD